jgi:hemoglobin
MNKIPTLYEWAGDMETFRNLFTKFYAKVLQDDLLGDVFKNMSPDHVEHVAHFVAEVFGGEKLYTTEDNGSHANMIGKHIGKMVGATAISYRRRSRPKIRSRVPFRICWLH